MLHRLIDGNYVQTEDGELIKTGDLKWSMPIVMPTVKINGEEMPMPEALEGALALAQHWRTKYKEMATKYADLQAERAGGDQPG